MNITKRKREQIHRGIMLRKFTYQQLGDAWGGISRQAARKRIMDAKAIPDNDIDAFNDVTGIELK